MWTPLPAYAELHCLSAFSFQRGASLPEELVQRAAALGYSALAITDACSVSGVVRAHTQAKELGLQLLLGAEFRVRNPASPGTRNNTQASLPHTSNPDNPAIGHDVTPDLIGHPWIAGQARNDRAKVNRSAARPVPDPETTLVVLAHDVSGWGNLCEFITAARSKAPKGEYDVSWDGSDFRSRRSAGRASAGRPANARAA